jgi:hypothetical protein
MSETQRRGSERSQNSDDLSDEDLKNISTTVFEGERIVKGPLARD